MSKQVIFWIGSIVGILVAACCWSDQLEEAEKESEASWHDGYRAGKQAGKLMREDKTNAND